MKEQLITYEQPLNEHIRVCLRLEHVFNQLDHGFADSTEWGSRQVVSALINILNIIDRPDLKTKLTQALLQYATTLSQLTHKPGIDAEKLNHILQRLEVLSDNLYAVRGKMGQQLRNNDFLNSIRLHLANPGGASPFSTPAYYLWLKRGIEQRQLDIRQWLVEFEPLREVVDLLLQLIRHTNTADIRMARNGFYQQSFDPNLPYQLVRVSIEIDQDLYPEISVGRHGLSVRWLELDKQLADAKSIQTQLDVGFRLACCKL